MKADTKVTVVMSVRLLVRGPQRHLAAVSRGGRRHHCSVDWASDSYRSSLLLTDPTCLCIFQTKNKKKHKFRFFLVSFTTTIFSQFSRPIFVRKIRLKSLNQIYRYLRTADSPVIKTTKKIEKKTAIETWSQKLASMAGLGLRIRQRMLTNCCFWYFLAIFFSKESEAKYSHFFNNMRPHYNSQF